jgi:phospholipid/cholesterol/gamma-HCH transport system permease protein
MVVQAKEFLQFICGKIGAAVIYVCTITGQLMLLLQAAVRQVPAVNCRETLRQMSLLGADSLPIVLMTILFTGMVFSVQTSKEFVRFGASASAGGVVAIALGRELVPGAGRRSGSRQDWRRYCGRDRHHESYGTD